MPEFKLNRSAYVNGDEPGVKTPHPFYRLNEFAQGYVEAMFFTNGDIGDEDRPDLLNDWGVERLTRESVARIAAFCGKFERDHAALLQEVYALEPGSDGFRYGKEPITPQRAGHFLWYACQGHGVGWTDDGNADCLERLQDICRDLDEAMVEAYRGWIYYHG